MSIEKALNKNHDEFEKFIDELIEACKFQETEGDATWECEHDLRRCRKILGTYENIDIEKTLKYFDENGGHCDCEVVFNIGC